MSVFHPARLVWYLAAFGLLLVACSGAGSRTCTTGPQCLRLGTDLDQSGGEPTRVLALYEQGCELGSARACHAAAEHRLAEDPNAPEEVLRLLFRSCQLVHDPACERLDTLCTERFDDTCDQRRITGATCNSARTCLDRGLDELARDHSSAAIARQYFERACDHGSLVGCWRGVEARLEEDSDAPSNELADPLLRACIGGEHEGCDLLATLAKERGRDLREIAVRSLSDSCQRDGPATACYGLGRVLLLPFKGSIAYAAALKYLERGCHLGEPEPAACSWAARVHSGKTFGFRPQRGASTRNAAALAKRACELDPAFCYELGIFHYRGVGVRRDEFRAATLFEKACDANSMDGCTQLAHFLQHGHGVRTDTPRARALFGRVCDEAPAYYPCTTFSSMLQEGSGGPPDIEAALPLWQRDCERFGARACNQGAWSRCHDLGVCDDASLELARNAVEKSPKGYIIDTLAFVLCRRGNEKEANAEYERSCKAGFKENCRRTCKDKRELPPRKKRSDDSPFDVRLNEPGDRDAATSCSWRERDWLPARHTPAPW